MGEGEMVVAGVDRKGNGAEIRERVRARKRGEIEQRKKIGGIGVLWD